MKENTYRFMLGALILIALYFDISSLMYLLIISLFAEGITNFPVPLLASKLLGTAYNSGETGNQAYRFNFEAIRAWRLLVASLLTLSYVFFYQSAWFFPWFLGFAILGAGASGVCPVAIILNRIGFK